MKMERVVDGGGRALATSRGCGSVAGLRWGSTPVASFDASMLAVEASAMVGVVESMVADIGMKEKRREPRRKCVKTRRKQRKAKGNENDARVCVKGESEAKTKKTRKKTK